MDLASSARAAEDRTGCTGVVARSTVVAKSSVVPQQPCTVMG